MSNLEYLGNHIRRFPKLHNLPRPPIEKEDGRKQEDPELEDERKEKKIMPSDDKIKVDEVLMPPLLPMGVEKRKYQEEDDEDDFFAKTSKKFKKSEE
jgi:hypothetical protein